MTHNDKFVIMKTDLSIFILKQYFTVVKKYSIHITHKYDHHFKVEYGVGGGRAFGPPPLVSLP